MIKAVVVVAAGAALCRAWNQPATKMLRLLVWLLTMHAVGIFLFTRGFLLTRAALPDVNSCEGSEEVGWCVCACVRTRMRNSETLRQCVCRVGGGLFNDGCTNVFPVVPSICGCLGVLAGRSYVQARGCHCHRRTPS